MAFEANSELEDILRMYRNQGKKEGSDHFLWDGFNYRPNEFTAAVALVRLLNLHREIRKRKRIASFYNARLANFTPALKVKHLEMKCRPSFYRYVVGVHDDGFGRTPTEIIDRLRRMKAPLEGLVHDYPLRSGYPLAEKVAKTHICLPLDSEEKAERWVKLAEYVLRN